MLRLKAALASATGRANLDRECRSEEGRRHAAPVSGPSRGTFVTYGGATDVERPRGLPASASAALPWWA